jgi:uncharacterized protein YecE (DUF72 family)
MARVREGLLSSQGSSENRDGLAKFFVGVSGFSYSSWKGKFYPKTVRSEEFLAFYSKHLNSVEINSSFYAQPRESVVKAWSETTKEPFRFSFKAPGQITHVLKLGEGSHQLAKRFANSLDLLGPRKGPILFQLPPYQRQDLRKLQDFLVGTVGVRDRIFEFRNDSWFQDSTFDLLKEYGAGFCVAETDDAKPVIKVVGDLAYIRLRKESYTPKAIGDWAGRIRGMSEDCRECYVYLRHDDSGENALHAEKLESMLVK